MKCQPFSILVADDDPTVRLLMQATLAGEQFVLTLADNGHSALAEFRRTPFDIVLLDVEMPGMDGLAVGAAIRESQGAAVKLVLVSGHNDAAFLAQRDELGATHISKPVNWSAIKQNLLDLLDVA